MTNARRRTRQRPASTAAKQAAQTPAMPTYSREGREIVELTLRTKVPEKWLAVDQETGDVWQSVDGGEWARANVNVLVLPKIPRAIAS